MRPAVYPETLMKSLSHSLICVGKVTSPHGVRGEVKFRPYVEDPGLLSSYLSHTKSFVDEEGASVAITSFRSGPKGMLLLGFEGVGSREEVTPWIGQEFYLDRRVLPAIVEEETYYVQDLVGLRVVTGDGKGSLVVTAVHNFGAGDILEVQDTARQTSSFIPFRREAVPQIDLDQGYLEVQSSFFLEKSVKAQKSLEGRKSAKTEKGLRAEKNVKAEKD